MSVAQQINLYQPALRPAAPALSARLIARALAGVVLCLVLLYGLARHRADAESAKVTQLSLQKSLASTRLEELERKVEQRNPDPALAKQVNELAEDTEAHRILVQAVQRRAPGSMHGFSRELEGLARSSLAGVWLGRISIQQGGDELLLFGHALDAQLVPEWLEGMRGKASLSGRMFQTVRIVKPKHSDSTRSGPVEFALGTGESLP